MSLSSSVKVFDGGLPGTVTAADLPRAPAEVVRSGSLPSCPMGLDRIRAVRQQLLEGTYSIDEHLDAVLDKVLSAIAVRAARTKTERRTSRKGNCKSATITIAAVDEPGSKVVGHRDSLGEATFDKSSGTVSSPIIGQGRTMKTHNKTNRKEAFQTVDDSARTAQMDAVPLRPTGDKKGTHGVLQSSVRCGGPFPVLTHEQIAERARTIWVERGRVPGEDQRNWHEAEAQLRRELGLDRPSL